MKQTAATILATALLLSACNNDEKWTKMIAGEWHGVSWIAEGDTVMKDPSKLTMILSKDSIYNLVADSRVENGNWYLKNDTLFLIPEMTEDIKMKIVALDAENLELRVFRGRVEEIKFKR